MVLLDLEHIWFCCVLLGGITQIKNVFLLELGLLAGAGGDEQGDSSVNSASYLSLYTQLYNDNHDHNKLTYLITMNS